jgi:hypothetical protein
MGTGAKIGIAVAVSLSLALLALVVWGLGLYEDEVCTHLKAQPAIVTRTGPLTSCAQNTLRSGSVSDMETFVFDVAGEKGKGTVYVRSLTDDEGNEVFQGISFEMGGEEIVVEGVRPPH